MASARAGRRHRHQLRHFTPPSRAATSHHQQRHDHAAPNAITFTGGTNVLELLQGFSITGNVVAVSGGSDTSG